MTKEEFNALTSKELREMNEKEFLAHLYEEIERNRYESEHNPIKAIEKILLAVLAALLLGAFISAVMLQ